VSLLESVGRQKMTEEEEKREKRKALRSSGAPLLDEDNVLADTVDPHRGEYPDMQEGEEEAAEAEEGEEAEDDQEDEDEGPDLLLREATRIVADMANLQSDTGLLEQHFVQLGDQPSEDPKLN
jgi:hypothetical protein